MQAFDFPIWKIVAGPVVALLVSYFMTPPVQRFAENVGAIDIPKDGRRVHNHPIPRMGGLAIFTGFVLSVLLFVNMSMQVMGLLLGAVIIAVMGALDDLLCLNPWIKLGGQFLAALVAIRCGIVFDVISNPGFLDAEATIPLGWLSIPFTIIWIIACTNAVNLIDGLDGLAVGISAISSISMMIVSMILPAGIVGIPLILACLAGACVGFMPYNINPAKIFMGDVGSQFLLLPADSARAESIPRRPRPYPPQADRHGDEPEAGRRRAVRGLGGAGPDRRAHCRSRNRDPYCLHRRRFCDFPDGLALCLFESASPSGASARRTPGRARCGTGCIESGRSRFRFARPGGA